MESLNFEKSELEELEKSKNKDEDLANLVKKKMIAKRKKLIIKNSIQLLIWLILLLFSFQYLSAHPAEKTSMVSSIKILYQRINVFTHKLFWSDWQILEQKYNQIRGLKDIISSIEASNCDLEEYDDIVSFYNKMVDMDLETYSSSWFEITSNLALYYELVKTKCDIK